MGKPRQQVISRFFAPKPRPDADADADADAGNTSVGNPRPSHKIAATLSFSPSSSASKRSLAQSPTRAPKRPRLIPNSNPSLHQRFLNKLFEPSNPSSESSKPNAGGPKYTPLELQILDLKSKHPDVLLMVEVGYKYRFFGDDAEIAAKVLGIFAHMDHNFLTASVPTFRLNFHVRRLVGAGYKVGVVKQTETAAIKAHGENRLGPFARGLSALYTMATIEAAEDMGGGGGGGEEEGAGGESNNYLVCVVEREVAIRKRECEIEGGFDVRVGMVAVEVSTGDVLHAEFNDNVMRSGLEAVILSLSPAEILLGEPLSTTTEKMLLAYAGPASNVRVERASRDCFNDGGALAEVVSLYENINNDNFTAEHVLENTTIGKEENHPIGIEGIMGMPELAVQALALTIRHLKQFGFERILILGASFRPFSSSIEMTLSANALHQLEVLKNNSDGSAEGSLLQVMNYTCTAFGSRLLRQWVSHPLRDRNLISARLDAVAEIAKSIGSHKASEDVFDPDGENLSKVRSPPVVNSIISSVLTMLGKCSDVQRGLTRIFHRTATPAEFISVVHMILLAGKQLQKLHIGDDDSNENIQVMTVKSTLLRRLIVAASSPSIIAHSTRLLSCLNRSAADQGDILNIFNAGNDQFLEVSRSHTSVHEAEEKLNSLIAQYRKLLGIRNLEFMCVSGITHLIELPLDTRVPRNWLKVNSTKKAVRYHPPEVLAGLEELLLAKEKLAVVCRTAWDRFLMGFSKYYGQFQASVQALAALDCLHSLAILSKTQNYIRPSFVGDEEPVQINICSGRHPVLESILRDNFVPNDTCMHEDGEYCQIVTGPNMGGKSCYIRQVALIAIMAQVGSFVPASSAKLHVLDGIFTRMGLSDSIQQGTSTFFEELSETSHILQNCSSRSLVIIDELGRGTSTYDGVAIAYATLHYLLKQKKCMTLFVTHYPKVMDIQHEFEGSVAAYHVSYLTSKKPLKVAYSRKGFSAENLDQGEVTFLYKVVRGASDKSFGLNVARLAQLPPSCITLAAIMAAKMESALSSCGRRQSQQLISLAARERCSSDCRTLKEESKCYHDLATGLHQLLSFLRGASDDANHVSIFSSLKDAKEVASNMIECYSKSVGQRDFTKALLA
ncbi:putative DNA mismatch repair protein MutS/MSH [Dioscorea sansibarensis]